MHEIIDFLGLTSGNSKWYLWWSGFGSDLAYVGAIVVFYRKATCHVNGCWRLGLHKVNGTGYTTCKRHHPHPDGPTAQDVQDASDMAKAQGDTPR